VHQVQSEQDLLHYDSYLSLFKLALSHDEPQQRAIASKSHH
jgi:hypothetical protein